MSDPLIDVVIACHDPSRPIERAVRSVLADDTARSLARVTVIAHGLDATTFDQRLAGIAGDWRVVPFADGARSAAGPFNHGLSLVETDYCAVMGSDDFLEPGAVAAWAEAVRERRPDMAIARIRIQGQAVMPNPLVRLGRHHDLDAERDRLFYRTAPLGLIRTATMRELDLRMTEGVRVGEDFEFTVRLFTEGRRIDLLEGLPCYVIGTDARERTTEATMSLEDDLAAVVRLVSSPAVRALPSRWRRSLAIKLVRVSVIGKARARSAAGTWIGDAEVAHVAGLLRSLIALAPGVLRPFNIQDRRVLDALLTEPTVSRLVRESARAASAGRLQRWLTPNPIFAMSRESTLRRFILYVLKRERKSRS
ncbi:glycosyltransferase [Microbacterium gorillae]|uniref:glycosyltransferase n=1 Tax=Microbacterium gorillae TaxID=1231063 RepID=UPI00058C7C06|nr:glycosyltransferase [Microbacterium gorillae]